MKLRNLIFGLSMFFLVLTASFTPLKINDADLTMQKPSWNKSLGERVEKPRKQILKFESMIFCA